MTQTVSPVTIAAAEVDLNACCYCQDPACEPLWSCVGGITPELRALRAEMSHRPTIHIRTARPTVVTCEYCGDLLDGLLDACAKPDCIEADIAYATASERWDDQ